MKCGNLEIAGNSHFLSASGSIMLWMNVMGVA